MKNVKHAKPVTHKGKKLRKRGPPPKRDLPIVKHVLKQASGNTAQAAKKLRVSRQTLYRYIRRNPSLQQIIADARSALVDDAESALHRGVRKGEAWAVCFTLKTQGKSRGYVERQELTGKDGEPIRQQHEHNAGSGFILSADDLAAADRFASMARCGISPDGDTKQMDSRNGQAH
jgi:hypothetical protein